MRTREAIGPKTAKFWYKITTYECPLCGRGKTYKERMYSVKPKNPAERYKYVQRYDWCDQ